MDEKEKRTLSLSEKTGAHPVDLVAFTDESGTRRLLRDITNATDGEISVFCTLPIPSEFEESVRTKIRPFFDRFVAAAPIGAKLHIAEAFKPGNETWGAVAKEVRSEIFQVMHEMRIIVIYVARRNELARRSFERLQSGIQNARENRRSKIRIDGENRLNDKRVDDDLILGLALMLDAFAEEKQRKCVEVVFDQIDSPVAKRYSNTVESTKTVTRRDHVP